MVHFRTSAAYLSDCRAAVERFETLVVRETGACSSMRSARLACSGRNPQIGLIQHVRIVSTSAHRARILPVSSTKNDRFSVGKAVVGMSSRSIGPVGETACRRHHRRERPTFTIIGEPTEVGNTASDAGSFSFIGDNGLGGVALTGTATFAVFAAHLVQNDRVPIVVPLILRSVILPCPRSQTHLLDWVELQAWFQHGSRFHLSPPMELVPSRSHAVSCDDIHLQKIELRPVRHRGVSRRTYRLEIRISSDLYQIFRLRWRHGSSLNNSSPNHGEIGNSGRLCQFPKPSHGAIHRCPGTRFYP